MTALYQYALAHPYLTVTVVAAVLISILNAVTRHYGDAHPGLRQALALIVDLLSLVHSRDSVSRGLKLPGSTSPRKPGRLVP